MMYIDIENNPPHDRWIEKARIKKEKLLQITDLNSRNEFIDNNPIWREIKSHLSKLSHCKCWYSETRDKYSFYHVDHFRPKKKALNLDKSEREGYWWLAYDWKNYRIIGSMGNVNKGTYFPLIGDYCCNGPDGSIDYEVNLFLDPTNRDDCNKITFGMDGDARPACSDEAMLDYKRACFTIKCLDLNYNLLSEARKAVWLDCDKKLGAVQKAMKEFGQNPTDANEKEI